jgi:hypothetical protein
MENTKTQRSTLTCAQAVDAVGDFWQGKTEPGVLTEALAVVEGRLLAADDPAKVLVQLPTSLEIFNRGY